MSIGYACLTIGVPSSQMKSCRMDNATEDRLFELITHNLNALENIIDYNVESGVKLFRVSSDIIPFGSSPVNTLDWWDLFEPQFTIIADKIQKNGIRISVHPGQYTVLNSPNEDVVSRAIKDLDYHAQLLRSLGGGPENKIVLHIGGVYGDKERAIKRFVESYDQLGDQIKEHLVIENDDRSYTIKDVLEIGESKGIPVVFDNLHHHVNKSHPEHDDTYWINRASKTWKAKDGKQKIHYSQQDPDKRPGGHSATIKVNEFMDYYDAISGGDLDIMLEVKDKNLSAIKCINSTTGEKKINKLEQEWSRYKYSVLEKAPASYAAIRQLLKDKDSYPATEFYSLIEEAMENEYTIGNHVNGLLHVWGYFKKPASEKEKKRFLDHIKQYQEDKIPLTRVKNMLRRLAIKYNKTYLLDSYYFEI